MVNSVLIMSPPLTGVPSSYFAANDPCRYIFDLPAQSALSLTSVVHGSARSVYAPDASMFAYSLTVRIGESLVCVIVSPDLATPVIVVPSSSVMLYRYCVKPGRVLVAFGSTSAVASNPLGTSIVSSTSVKFEAELLLNPRKFSVGILRAGSSRRLLAVFSPLLLPLMLSTRHSLLPLGHGTSPSPERRYSVHAGARAVRVRSWPCGSTIVCVTTAGPSATSFSPASGGVALNWPTK